MDNGQKLLVQLTVGQLKTIEACAILRQHTMRQHAAQMRESLSWEVADAANTEADKAYSLGRYMGTLISSLSPERIEDEWTDDGIGIERLVRRVDFPPGSYFNPAAEEEE